MFGARTSFPTNPWTTYVKRIPDPTQETEQIYQPPPGEPLEDCMEGKQVVNNKRDKLKKLRKKDKDPNKRLPGYKLLCKLRKQQQIENSIIRVIKILSVD